jgi:phage terminase large subunit
MKLSVKQTIAIDYLEDTDTNVILYGGGAGGGKSMLGAYWVLKQCLKYPNTRYVIGRSRLKNLKETTLRSLFEVCSMQGLTANVDFTYNETKSLITIHQTKSEILLKDLFHYPSDPNFDSLGSMEITGAFIDEATEITTTAYNVIQSRMRYNLDKHGLTPKLLMTCNPSKGWIYSEFYKKFKDGTLDDNKQFVQSLVTDNPNISKHYINQLRQLDVLSQKRLLFGDWEYSDDDTQLFSIDALNDMFTNEYVSGVGQKYISVDVARYGRDQSVVCLWHDWRCEEIKTFDKNSIDELANIVDQLAKKHNVQRSNIVADSDGVGGGFVDMLKGCKSFVNNSKALDNENFRNLKTQCYYKFAQRVMNGQIYINTNNGELKNKIIMEFEMVKQHDIDKDNKLSITPKDKIKSLLGRSPDLSDALIMRYYFELSKTKILYFG